MSGNYSSIRNNLWQINRDNLLFGGLESATPSPVSTSSSITLVTMYSFGVGASPIAMDVAGTPSTSIFFELPTTNAMWTNSVSPWVIRYEDATYTFSDQPGYNNSTARAFAPIAGHFYNICLSAVVTTVADSHADADITNVSKSCGIQATYYDADEEGYIDFHVIGGSSESAPITYPASYNNITGGNEGAFSASGWVYVPNIPENQYLIFPRLEMIITASSSMATAEMKLVSLNYTVLDYGTTFNALLGI